MPASTKERTISANRMAAALLDRHGQTYCEELGIPIDTNSPSALFCWLCAALLFSARISAGLALRGMRALIDEGWTTPEQMEKAGWSKRTSVLNRAGYARYDERTSTMLGEAAQLLLRKYDGDLRRLREQAGRAVGAERRLLKEFKGIGGVGADIFCREVQTAWRELYPFADARALAAAATLALAHDVDTLARLFPPRNFPRLVTALVRTALAKDQAAIREAAGS
jgi:hypothetical protein